MDIKLKIEDFKLIENQSKIYFNTSIWENKNYGDIEIIGKVDKFRKRKNRNPEYCFYLCRFEDDTLVVADINSIKYGKIKNPYDASIFGIGYFGQKVLDFNGEVKTTKEYSDWYSMFVRCYDPKYHENQPTYKDCEVCEEWWNFQNFYIWHKNNYYLVENEKIELDKDILIKNNKIYSPETCVFVPKRINQLFNNKKRVRGKYPLGVSFVENINKFMVQCSDGNGYQTTLGVFKDVEMAFKTYKIFKMNVLKRIANEYKNKIPESLYLAILNYKILITD